MARDISNALHGEPDIEQMVVCFNENSSDGDHVCRRGETVREVIDGVEVVKCSCFTKAASQSLSTSFGRELRKIMNEFRPDIVLFHYPNPFQALYLLRYKKRGFKLVLYWHLDITKQKILKHLFYHQNRELIRRAQYIIGATPMHVDRSEFSEYFGNRKKVLPYMIDTGKLELTPEEKSGALEIREKYKDRVIGFFIGRHVPYKGLRYLIEASRELTDSNLKILIAGEGELTEALKKQAHGDEKIEFLGRISDSEKRMYYEAADIICFPSVTRNEGFGLALAEGMSFGKPAVTFTVDGSGINYVNLADVTGLECPNADSHAYAQALRRLSEDAGLRQKMGEAAKERVEKLFTPEQFKKNVTELVRSL